MHHSHSCQLCFRSMKLTCDDVNGWVLSKALCPSRRLCSLRGMVRVHGAPRLLLLWLLLALTHARLLDSNKSPPSSLHGLAAAWAWFRDYWWLVLIALLFTACFLVSCLAVVQHTQLVCALCLLKAAIAVLCCCFPKIQAWFEDQMAAASEKHPQGGRGSVVGMSTRVAPPDESTPLAVKTL